MAVDIQGGLFDLDHTLYEYGPNRYSLYAMAAATAARNLGLQKSLSEALAIATESGRQTKSEIAHFVEKHGVPEAALFEEYHVIAAGLFVHDIKPVADLSGVFNRLVPGFKVAILTHSPNSWATPILKHISLDGAFPANMVFAQDHPVINFRKKNECREIFEFAVGEMGLKPENVAMFDDMDENHVIPASMGMHTVLREWGTPSTAPLPPYIRERTTNIGDFLLAHKLCRPV